jgi:hypothetical protein
MAVLIPEVRKLALNVPAYGELILKAKVSSFEIGTIELGIITARRVTAQPRKGGGYDD